MTLSESLTAGVAGSGGGSATTASAELTIIVVTWNTRELTLKCLETLFENTHGVSMRVIVVDNHSEDGSADVIEKRFPQLELLRNTEDCGFARANNRAIALVESEWVLLLNPDTEVHPNAITNLLEFSKKHPRAGITGGRTVFRDGSLNIASCWNKMTPWSLFCSFTGLSIAFSQSAFFNPEAIGGWKRDSVRQVDIVQGSFLMIPTALWRRLEGFNSRYFMYGEEADMALRAAQLGYRPMITPDAEIMHLGGASAPKGVRLLQLWKSKATMVRDHWPKHLVAIGLIELWLCSATRKLGSFVQGVLRGGADREDVWGLLWDNRHDWLKGY